MASTLNLHGFNFSSLLTSYRRVSQAELRSRSFSLNARIHAQPSTISQAVTKKNTSISSEVEVPKSKLKNPVTPNLRDSELSALRRTVQPSQPPPFIETHLEPYWHPLALWHLILVHLISLRTEMGMRCPLNGWLPFMQRRHEARLISPTLLVSHVGFVKEDEDVVGHI